MRVLLLVVISLVILALLAQINGLLAILFFLAVVLTVPALMMHRREMAAGIEYGSDAESTGQGVMRLMRMLGLDTTGIALGVLLLVLSAILIKIAGQHLGHR